MSKLIDRIGQFTTIPNSVIEMWPKIGVDAIALFLYLRYRTNSQSEMAFPSYDTIQSDTGLTRRRIALAIRVLESAGLVERKRRFSNSTLYTLKMPDAISKDAVLMEKPISKDAVLPLVQGVHANHTDLIKTENNIAAKTRKKKQEHDPLLDNPAVIAYRDHARLTPNHDQREEIARRVGDKVEQWRGIVRDWMLAGYKPGNVAGMLDAFSNGGLTRKFVPQQDQKVLEFTR